MTGHESKFVAEEREFPEGLDRETRVRVRVNQGFFRSAVLAAYESRCCVTGLSIPQLLNASHIVPWSVDPKNRTNPQNGLCLNVIHDRAFDNGLLTITPDLKIRVATKLKRNMANKAAQNFCGISRAYPYLPLDVLLHTSTSSATITKKYSLGLRPGLEYVRMANITFSYLYRDAGNYKKRNSVVFTNPEGFLS